MRSTNFTRGNYSLCQFERRDWMALKQIRLEALCREPNLFGSSFEENARLPDSSWQERIAANNRAYFGLLLPDGECVGLSAITQQIDLADSVVLIASYIRKEHRGQGLSNLFYDARIDWARQSGYAKAIVSHRDTNLVSRAANQRAGFHFIHLTERDWPDGTTSNELFYELIL